jgi:hypothetical protein
MRHDSPRKSLKTTYSISHAADTIAACDLGAVESDEVFANGFE